jgi:hypothetical protein
VLNNGAIYFGRQQKSNVVVKQKSPLDANNRSVLYLALNQVNSLQEIIWQHSIQYKVMQ